MGVRDWWAKTTTLTPGARAELERKAIVAALPIVSDARTQSPRWGLFGDWTVERAAKDGYEISSIVRAVVDKVAVPVRNVPWRVSRLMEDEEAKTRFAWEMKGIPADQRSEFIKAKHEGRNWSKKTHLQPMVEHPLEKLIMQPNRFYSGPDYMEMSAQHLMLGGNTIFVQSRNSEVAGGRTINLWLVPPDQMWPERDRNLWIKNYFINDRQKSEPRKIPARDVVHLMLPNPRDMFWGVSPLKSAAMSVDTDVEAVSWNKIALQNRTVTSGVFSFDKPMNLDKWEEARQMVAEQHQGGDNAWAPWVLGAGAKWQQMSLSPVEMDFIRGRNMTRDDVSLVFGVDPRIYGAGEATANREAIDAIWRHHWLQLLLPFLNRYEDAFNRVLVPEYPGENLFVWYDTSNIDALRESDIDKARVAKIWWSMGYPPNVINERFRAGFPPIEFGDVGLVPASAITVERAILGDTKPSSNPTGQDTSPDGGDNITEPAAVPDAPDATGVTAEVGNEGVKMLPDPGGYSNGHTKTWTEEEVVQHLEDELMMLPEHYTIEQHQDGNHFAVKSEDNPTYLLYHGGRDLMLAAKHKDWGWTE